MDQPRTINLDGISYDTQQFSQGVQQAIVIYNKFNSQLQDLQLEVMKTQAALQQVGGQISEAVKKELADKQAAANGSTVASAPPAGEENATAP
jgi:hypothetical protein